MSKFNREYTIRMKDIVREGAKILRKVTEEVSLPPGEEVVEELHCMMQYLKNSQDPELSKQYRLRPGVGLSANQIGLDKRMFVAYFTDEYGDQHEYMLINPKIISHSVGIIYLSEGEGCLSVDRPVKGYVPRYQRIKVRAYDMDGNEVLLAFKGYGSIVMQHEIDHLNGIMFYDYIDKKDPYKLPGNVPIERL
ncbi:peptide deformylase [Brevibacillus invocatus]|uniref:Peptide deformylase n=1 Tax=Brevibacillus invocatus TaxID=173959 RepID=A0A3M8CGU2_9BACL|nr:peptide deformylase [Brevibacillus invocatus]MCM3079055.1 peptide deformylase [Brevibacillus invocatus]MCM3429882.1 peptide deformylase [Brevibacillus invocatus]RNB74849.1 peptide deformylase [Brevibacillus invocatus]